MQQFKIWLQNEDMLPYIPVDNNLGANSGMGIPSKYVGPDETGENAFKNKKKPALADFGFDNRIAKLKKRLRNINK